MSAAGADETRRVVDDGLEAGSVGGVGLVAALSAEQGGGIGAGAAEAVGADVGFGCESPDWV